MPAAAATSALPRPHQATADTGAWRSMTWRKNGEQPSSPAPSLVSSREGEGRWDTTRKDPAAYATQGRPPRSGRKAIARGSWVGAGGIRCGGPRARGNGGSVSRSPIVAPAAACTAAAAMAVVAWSCGSPHRRLPRPISANRRQLCARTWARRGLLGHDVDFLC